MKECLKKILFEKVPEVTGREDMMVGFSVEVIE